MIVEGQARRPHTGLPPPPPLASWVKTVALGLDVLLAPQIQDITAALNGSTADTNVTLKEANVSQPLPPSSFQRFLRAKQIPGVVLADHPSSFHNR